MAGRGLLIIAITAMASPALADPAAEDAFRKGRDSLKAGKLDEACGLFQRSQDLEPKVGTLLNLADCRERQGRIATAWELFVQAKALALKVKDDRAGAAGKRADALVAQRAFLTVHITERIPELTVERDATKVPDSAWDIELPIDPGAYTLVATAPGHERAEIKVTIEPKSKATATIPKLVAIAPEPPITTATTPTTPTTPTTTTTTSATPTTTPPAMTTVTTSVATASKVQPPLRTYSVGVGVGATNDRDFGGGVRVSAGFPVTGGALRAFLGATYVELANEDNDPYDDGGSFTIGVGIDYVLAWRAGLASAIGAGIGYELVNEPYNNPNTSQLWVAPRVSPLIVRFEAVPLEIGVHAQVLLPENLLVALVGIDWFIR